MHGASRLSARRLRSGLLLVGTGAALLLPFGCARQPALAPPVAVKAQSKGLVLLSPETLVPAPASNALVLSSQAKQEPTASGSGAAQPPPVPAGPPEWRDDSTSNSLTAAIAQSLNYYRILPTDTKIAVGSLTYTAGELARSLELFLALRLTVRDPAAFAEEIRQKFLVFESIAEQGDNLFTGYYEPHIRGSLVPTAEFSSPLYARPTDLVEVALEDFGKDLPRRRVVGRVQNGRLVPYYSREEIQQGGVLEGRAQPIAYVNDVDLFFLQIQGSGQVELPDGRKLYVGYDSSNGQPYRALGAEMIRRNLMAKEEVSLFSLKRYLSEHKDIGPALLNTNPSYVFFRTLDDTRGPLGNLQVPLTPGRSLAADRLLLPPGVLAYVMTTAPIPDQPGAFSAVDRFMLLQDTGGAIRGHGRGDLFWGEGPEAEWIAGRAKQPGRLFILVAKKEALPPVAPSPKSVAPVAPPQVLGRPLQARMP